MINVFVTIRNTLEDRFVMKKKQEKASYLVRLLQKIYELDNHINTCNVAYKIV